VKYLLFIFCLIISNFSLGKVSIIDSSVIEVFNNHDFSKVTTIKELATEISVLTNSNSKKLQLLLLWSDRFMFVDSARFFAYGAPKNIAQAFKERKGLCDEFSGIVNEFCQIQHIPCFKVTGYVAEGETIDNSLFVEENHAWNAVFIDNTWLLCDLFWSTSKLNSNNSFIKKLDETYFLANGYAFMHNHLPADPVFQLLDYPIKIDSFKKIIDEIEPTNHLCNYKDSLAALLKMDVKEQNVKIARQAYNYNPLNPNILAIALYNYGVSIIKNKSANKAEFIKANHLFTEAIPLTEKSSKPYIKELKSSCESGIKFANQKLSIK